MLSTMLTVSAYATALALVSAMLLVGVPRLLFWLEPRVSAGLKAAERWLEHSDSQQPPDRHSGGPGSNLWPRISGPA